MELSIAQARDLSSDAVLSVSLGSFHRIAAVGSKEPLVFPADALQLQSKGSSAPSIKI